MTSILASSSKSKIGSGAPLKAICSLKIYLNAPQASRKKNAASTIVPTRQSFRE
jgi:hypothetical protein